MRKNKFFLVIIFVLAGTLREAFCDTITIPDVVVSGVYGAGGNAGASLKNDYVELYNTTDSTIHLQEYTLYYIAAANTNSAAAFTFPAGSAIGAKKFALVKAGGGANGNELPTPDFDASGIGGGSFNMAASSGKILLLKTQHNLSASGSIPATVSGIQSMADYVDYMPYGTTSITPVFGTTTTNLTTTTAAKRKYNDTTKIIQYTFDVGADFVIVAADTNTPRSSNYVVFCNIPVTYYADTICQGAFYTDNNFINLTKDSVYCDTLKNGNGCDSVIEFTLSYYPTVPITQYADTLCFGEIYNDANFTNKTAAGIYYDTLQNGNGCDSVIELTLIVNPLPNVPLITKSENILTSTIADSYQWYFNNAVISGATNQTYLYTQNGKYMIEVGNEYGCTEKSEEITVNDVGIVSATLNNQLRIYPNPTNGQLKMENGELTIESIEIYDVVGQMLQSTIVNLQSEITIDISHLANGMYFLKMEGMIVKFIKE